MNYIERFTPPLFPQSYQCLPIFQWIIEQDHNLRYKIDLMERQTNPFKLQHGASISHICWFVDLMVCAKFCGNMWKIFACRWNKLKYWILLDAANMSVWFSFYSCVQENCVLHVWPYCHQWNQFSVGPP